MPIAVFFLVQTIQSNVPMDSRYLNNPILLTEHSYHLYATIIKISNNHLFVSYNKY